MPVNLKLIFIGFVFFVLIATIATLATLLGTSYSNSNSHNDDNETTEPPDDEVTGSTEPPDEIKTFSHVWGYECEENMCSKVEITIENFQNTTSLNVCRLTCGIDIMTLWPKPTGTVEFLRTVVKVNTNRITYFTNNFKNDPDTWFMAWQRFRDMQFQKVHFYNGTDLVAGKPLVVEISAQSDNMSLTYETYEGYRLKISEEVDQIYVYLQAENFYGIRHALETLSQLIVYDEFENAVVLISNADIQDEPKFKHRGLSMDTSRNFYSVDVIKRTINGLAMNKMNVFHWHITDSQSMPLELKSNPEITRLGAYSPDKIYSISDIKDIVRYAKARGVLVIPEFDSPGHVGEGWQNTDFTLCYKDTSMAAQWRGHFDPTKDELYDVLEDIYRDIIESFDPSVFHMGNDEVRFSCWNSSSSIQEWMTMEGWDLEEIDFMNLWGRYLENARERLDRTLDRNARVIIWSSDMTEVPYQFINKDRYIVQCWGDSSSPTVSNLLANGYKVIISNSDALYLDCGVGSWVNSGLNWCAPYKSSQNIYNNRFEAMAGSYIDQVLGAEVSMWSESSDERVIDQKLWPRTAALAERLWTNPEEPWRSAELRFLMNRLRLIEIGGLAPEPMQPEWCFLKQGDCY